MQRTYILWSSIKHELISTLVCNWMVVILNLSAGIELVRMFCIWIWLAAVYYIDIFFFIVATPSATHNRFLSQPYPFHILVLLMGFMHETEWIHLVLRNMFEYWKMFELQRFSYCVCVKISLNLYVQGIWTIAIITIIIWMQLSIGSASSFRYKWIHPMLVIAIVVVLLTLVSFRLIHSWKATHYVTRPWSMHCLCSFIETFARNQTERLSIFFSQKKNQHKID